ncbi:MAG TPA: hypothetical protein VMA71_08670 [Alloacidobacterium sp.]|nr:hypothetical protein [Alloacidobacterium sp.]
MQVPAGATGTTGTQGAGHNASLSLLDGMGESVLPKTGQAHTFGTVLLEHSVEAVRTPEEKSAIAAGSDEEKALVAGTLAVKAQTDPAPLAATFSHQEKNTEGALSGASPNTKSETKPARKRTLSDTPSFAPTKKPGLSEGSFAQAAAVVVPVPLVVAPSLQTVAPEEPLRRPVWLPIPAGSSLTQPTQGLEIQREELLPTVRPDAGTSSSVTLGNGALAKDSSGTVLLQHEKALPQNQPQVASVMPHLSEYPKQTPMNESQAGRESSRLEANCPSGLQSAPRHADAIPAEAMAPSVSRSPGTASTKRAQENPANSGLRGLALASHSGSSAPSTDQTRTDIGVVGIASVQRPAEAGALSARQGSAQLDTNAFQHLDAAEAPASLLHSSPHQIAVGLRDPSLGWVEVQTASSAGHVSATLTASSAAAHASLSVQASAITQYLTDRNVSVHSLHVNTQGEAQGGFGGGGQSQPGSNADHQQISGQQSVGADSSSHAAKSETTDEGDPLAHSASYISVRA